MLLPDPRQKDGAGCVHRRQAAPVEQSVHLPLKLLNHPLKVRSENSLFTISYQCLLFFCLSQTCLDKRSVLMNQNSGKRRDSF
jgi:hypothetical protein